MSAKEAFKSYVRAYDAHSLKTIFDVNSLDLIQVGKSFGFTTPPAVDLSKSKFRYCLFSFEIIQQFFADCKGRKHDRRGTDGFGSYKNSDQYRRPQKKKDGDNRQFAR